jgi:hypothetical protein
MLDRLAALTLLLLVGCRGPEPATQVDRVEMRLSGMFSTDVAVNRRGQGQYRLSGRGKQSNGTFSISPRSFSRLLARLEPFRKEAVPYTEKSALEMITRSCPKGVSFVTDSGSIWVRWIGPSADFHYMADLGCDTKRNARRNDELRDVFKSLPLPRN